MLPSNRLRLCISMLCTTWCALASTPALAHGIWGHIHVTGWAIENLPEGELKDFFADPEVLNAALFGAAFPDSGYWPQGGDLATRARTYGEHTHWEPFVEDYITWMLANDPPPFDSLESRKRVAFLMGCAAHGLQDEVFDSLFLYQVDEHDNAGQDAADPASDGFLALDDHLRFIPETYLPTTVLLAIYSDLNEPIDADTITRSTQIMTDLYVNGVLGQAIAEGQGTSYESTLPWTRAYYLDPGIPGSLRAEIAPTRAYLQALWDRLHSRWQPGQPVIHTYPEAPRRLLSHDANTPDAWVTFIVGEGVRNGSAQASWLDESNQPVAFTRRDTRWGGAGWSRLVRLQPDSALTPGAWYTAQLEPGAEMISGATLTTPQPLNFQVECAPADPVVCPALQLEIPRIDPPPMMMMDDSAEAMAPGTTADGLESDSNLSDRTSSDLASSLDPGNPTNPSGAAEGMLEQQNDSPGGVMTERDDEGCGCQVHAAGDEPTWPLMGVMLLWLVGRLRGRGSASRCR